MSSGMHPPDGPPVCTDFTRRPPGAPSPTSYTKVFSGVPNGISTSPVLVILPTREKTFVPELFGLPVSLNHAGPFMMIGAMLYQVSTLLMLVGLPHNPFCAGNGGRGRGLPALLSSDATSAVPSPQANAPPPPPATR